MSKWCDTCYRNELTDSWQPCTKDCPVFGKGTRDLARAVVSMNGISIRSRCRHMRDDGICLNEKSSAGVCYSHCDLYARVEENDNVGEGKVSHIDDLMKPLNALPNSKTLSEVEKDGRVITSKPYRIKNEHVYSINVYEFDGEIYITMYRDLECIKFIHVGDQIYRRDESV